MRLTLPLLWLTLCFAAQGGTVLDKIRSTQVLSCGIVKEEPDWSKEDAHGNRAVFDTDICQATAVAVLGEHAKFTLTAYPDEEAATNALKAGAIALIPTLSQNLKTIAPGSGVQTGPTLLYDGQSFLVPRGVGIGTAKALSGRKVCFIADTEVEENLRGWVARDHIEFVPFPFQEQGEMAAAFVTGNCSALAGDITWLAYTRALFHSRAGEYDILPDVIGKDPLAPLVLAGDREWAAIVSWTVSVLIEAEERGLTQGNVHTFTGRQTDPAIRRIIGTEAGLGKALGLEEGWGARVIAAVGNYGEIYERGLGMQSPLKLRRGLNGLWSRGGLLYAVPVRWE